MEIISLEHQWNHLFNSFGRESFLSSTFNDLVYKYSEKHRFYHTLVHIDSCLKKLDEVSDSITDIFSLKVAIWFHDVIYDPLRNDNEEMSARCAQNFLSVLQLNQEEISKIIGLIELTKHNKIPIIDDEKYLLDIDVSILGADAEIYRIYEDSIREEYRQVPDLTYKEGRKKILQSFLGLESIYYTRYFQEQFEKQARENICKAISNLD